MGSSRHHGDRVKSAEEMNRTMTMKTKPRVHTHAESHLSRREELKRSLEQRRSELVAMLHERMQGVRAEHEIRALAGRVDDGEVSEVDIQEDIELALIQMKSETLGHIDESLERLEAGVYGQCSSCGHPIATPRLLALPFAVRCRPCEEQNETRRQRTRTDQGRGRPFLVDSRHRDPEFR
jgi:RNA polymerase-binding transcription factor